MSTEGKIQPPGATPPPGVTPTPTPTSGTTAPPPGAVTPTPPAPGAPGTAAPGTVPTPSAHPISDRLKEIWQSVTPYMDRRALYAIVILGLGVAGYFGYEYFTSESKKTGSERWLKWLMLSDPTDVRLAVDKVKKAREKDRPGWTPPDPLALGEYLPYDEAVQRQLIDDFVQPIPDTIQARIARIQLGRFLMVNAMRDIGLAAGTRPPPPHAAEVLQSVADTFQKLAPELEDDPVLRDEVLLTEAKARETLGEVGKAMELYHQLADPEKTKYTAASKEAAACLKRLEAPGGREEAERLARTYVKPATQ